MGLDNIIKRILNETKEEKLKSLFDDYIEEYENLIEYQREYEDDDYDIYNALVYYEKNEEGDIDEDDWEDDNYVFKVIPIDNFGEKYNLEYSKFKLRGGLSTFGKSIFERFLKPWFESTYKMKIENVYPV